MRAFGFLLASSVGGLTALLAAGCGSDDSGAKIAPKQDVPARDAGAKPPVDAGAPDGATPPDAALPDAGSVGDPATGKWRAGFHLPGLSGFGGRVYATAKAANGHVFAGGIFVDAAGVPASNVAEWTGTEWKALGAGLPGDIRAVAVGADGALYAAGDRPLGTKVGHVSKWDGTTWTTLPGDIDGDVDVIAAQGPRIVVGGSFTKVGALSAANLAAYGQAGWSTVGTTGTDGEVKAIYVDDATKLCVGGTFETVDAVAASNVACWSGTAWTQLGNGAPGSVSRIVKSAAGKFYIGGSLVFSNPNGPGPAGVGVLEGQTWQVLGGGVDGGAITEVRALAFTNDGGLLVGGCFGGAGGDGAGHVRATNIARFDLATSKWSDVGGAVNEVGTFLGSVIGVNDVLALGDGSFVVGGLFSTVNGTVPAQSIARLQGTAWSALVSPGPRGLGIGGNVNVITFDAKGSLLAGGQFSAAGGTRAANIARLGEKGWEPLGVGLDTGDTYVATILPRANGEVIAGGTFTRTDATRVPYLARFDGNAWSSLGDAPDGPVSTVIDDGKGGLYVGGDFGKIGALVANGVARWDGSKWSALGAGFDNVVDSLAIDGSGALVATGHFKKSGTTVVSGLARWDGAAWQAFGTGLKAKGLLYGVKVLAEGKGFVVAGKFDEVDGKPFAGLARWDGAQWSTFGAPLTDRNLVQVNDLVRYGQGFFATGIFSGGGTTEVLTHIAWWDGAAWRPLDVGLNDLGATFAVKGSTLWVGGPFVTAGGRSSIGIGAWDFGH